MHANDGCCCHSVVDCCLFCFHLSICCWCWLFVAFIVHVLLLFMARFHLRVQCNDAVCKPSYLHYPQWLIVVCDTLLHVIVCCCCFVTCCFCSMFMMLVYCWWWILMMIVVAFSYLVFCHKLWQITYFWYVFSCSLDKFSGTIPGHDMPAASMVGKKAQLLDIS